MAWSDEAVKAAWDKIESMSFDETSDKECMRAALDAAAAVDGDAQWNATLDGPEFERAYSLMIRGEPVGGGDGGTYVSRIPSKDDFRAAIRSLKRD